MPETAKLPTLIVVRTLATKDGRSVQLDFRFEVECDPSTPFLGTLYNLIGQPRDPAKVVAALGESKPWSMLVTRAVKGRWNEILPALAGIPADVLDGRLHDCPKCGGKGKFRFVNSQGNGAIVCKQCAISRCGDGMETIRWATGWTFQVIVNRMVDFLGIEIE